ncbi:hypothetical protein OLMES_1575 [Oleiphilus messinensis]|uniref:Uncharacterized protein n=1 Tax=Oleiphilus messinensis TaxID=141451 RepID=A0A1Y0I5Y3_9GAMM|nr:hypothetical protein [Oleiphilus messinensis]ARU55650.1 hypothetical protein OLMES_1575 [Oleiphilus messinensis]
MRQYSGRNATARGDQYLITRRTSLFELDGASIDTLEDVLAQEKTETYQNSATITKRRHYIEFP